MTNYNQEEINQRPQTNVRAIPLNQRARHEIPQQEILQPDLQQPQPTPPSRPKHISDLLTAEEAAEYLGIKAQTLAVWRCTKRHEIPIVKIGRLVKYKKVDLDAFIAKQTRA